MQSSKIQRLPIPTVIIFLCQNRIFMILLKIGAKIDLSFGITKYFRGYSVFIYFQNKKNALDITSQALPLYYLLPLYWPKISDRYQKFLKNVSLRDDVDTPTLIFMLDDGVGFSLEEHCQSAAGISLAHFGHFVALVADGEPCAVEDIQIDALVIIE